jgi:hypothetical protein
MPFWSDLRGTLASTFRLGLTGVQIKAASGRLQVRNTADTANAGLTAADLEIDSDTLRLNADATGSGNNWAFDLARPTTGQLAAQTWRFPAGLGTAGQVLSTDGAGNHSYISVNGSDSQKTDTTSFVFGSTSPLALFTLPAGATISEVRILVDTAFSGGTGATVSLGVSATPAKYVPAIPGLLSEASAYNFLPGVTAPGSAEALIATYAANGATAGAGRIEIDYVVPQ